MSLRLGVHVGQQNMTMDAMRQLWRKLDEKVDWISAWAVSYTHLTLQTNREV